MPPKASSSATKSSKPQGPTREELEAINNYLAQKPDFNKLIQEANANQQPESVKKVDTEYDKKSREAVKEVIEERRKEFDAKKAKETIMPVHPKEEEAGSNLTDQVAKESKGSTASTHPLHNEGAATMDDHKANPGPVMAENLGEPASKEELKKRAEELNKK